MEIVLDKRAVRQIRLSAQDAIEEGDTETLREDIIDAFTEEQVEEIERRLDTGDFFEFLETQLGDVSIDLKYDVAETDEEEEDEAVADDDDDDADSDEEEEKDED